MICDQFVRRLSMLTGKKIVLGITGGIAAYKSAELTRRLIKSGAEVKVIMTRNATEFITPLTLQTLTGHPVFINMFSLTESPKLAILLWLSIPI